jgi:hypothetical protein
MGSSASVAFFSVSLASHRTWPGKHTLVRKGVQLKTWSILNRFVCLCLA